jgi:preprotein translocase subunit SecG
MAEVSVGLNEQAIYTRKGWGEAMKKSLKIFVVFLALLSVLFVGSYAKKAHARAPQQYPILDALAGKVVQKYQASSCEQLWVKKSQNTPPKPEEQKLIQLLHNDPQMRAEFINRVAAPIANKMFECGMIP